MFANEGSKNSAQDDQKPKNIDDLKLELIAALDEEIKEIEEKGSGSSQYKISNGTLLKQEGDFFIYRFVTDDIVDLPDDLPIEVKIPNSVVSGNIVSIQSFEITISVEEDLGEHVPSAVLLSSGKFLLERIKSCLEDLEEINPKFNFDIVKKTFGLINQKLSSLPQEIKIHSMFKNQNQIEAIEFSLKNEILFIWGPPGTGKTTTLGGIVSSYLDNGKDLKLLVLSHTNVATDQAAKKIIEMCSDHPILKDGKIIRVGNIIESEKNRVLSKQDASFVKVAEIAEKKTSDLVKKKTLLEEELQNLLKENHKIHGLLEKRKELNEILDRINKLKKLPEGIEFEETEAKSGLNFYKKKLDKINNDIRKANNSNKFMRFVSGLNLEQLNSEKAEINNDYEKWKIRLAAVNKKIEEFNKGFRESKKIYNLAFNELYFVHVENDSINKDIIINDFDNDEVKVECNSCDTLLSLKNEKNIYRCPDCKYEFKFFPIKGSRGINWEKLELDKEKNQNRIQELRKEISELETQINKIKDQIIKEARVIITTVTQSYSSKLISSMNFDVIVIDEASMIPLPIVFFVSGLGSKHVVIIGDFKQLPPISISDNKYLKTDIFHYSGVKNNVENNVKDDRLVALNEQYRMHPEISEICNNYVYRPQNELIDSPKVKQAEFHKYLENKPYSSDPIVFCDTTCAKPWCSSTPSYSVFNLYHAILVMKLIEDALNDGVPGEAIGVVTPFRDQAKFINRMQQKIFPGVGVKVNTVHKFQGLENDIVIFDTVVSYGKKGGPGYFFGKLEQASRLLNVAITRPKSKLIIIGNSAYLNDKLDTDTLIFKVLDHFKAKKKVFDSDNIIEKYYEQLKLTKERFRKEFDQEIKTEFFNLVDQNDFFDIFKSDLMSVEKNEGVVIYSPFIQFSRTSDLMNHFKFVVDKGASLTIFTEKRYQNPGLFSDPIKEVIEYLKEIGANFKFKSRLHEKRAFISNRIWWEGSLNILSHSTTTEDMLRFSQKDLVDLAIKNFGLSDLLGAGKIKREARENWRSKVAIALKNEERRCPDCTERLVVKFSRYGPFLACDKRLCKHTASIPTKNYKKRIDDAEMKCTECSKGIMSVVTSRKGGKFSVFLACDNYPECKFIPRL